MLPTKAKSLLDARNNRVGKLKQQFDQQVKHNAWNNSIVITQIHRLPTTTPAKMDIVAPFVL